MTIEIAPSPLPTAVAPPRDEASADKNRSGTATPPAEGRSFGEVLDAQDAPAAALAPGAGRPVAADGVQGDARSGKALSGHALGARALSGDALPNAALADALDTQPTDGAGDAHAGTGQPGWGTVDPALLLAQGWVLSPPTPQAAGAGEPVSEPGAGPRARAGQAVWLSEGSAAASPAGPGGAGHAAGTALRTGKAALDAAHQANQADQAAQAAQSGSTTLAAMAADSASAKEGLPAPVQAWAQALASAVARPAEGNTLVWGEPRKASEGAEGAPRVVLTDPSSAALTSGTGQGGAMGVDGVVAAGSGAAADGHAPEQVHYWVGTEMQKAELTLDGVGASAVEVSIAMQGNEATVSFRSDEALTREALARASDQLQDAMARQGVLLSGVSVGTSHGGDPSRQGQGQSQSPKPSGWKLAGVSAAGQDAPRADRAGGSGRRLDLYV